MILPQPPPDPEAHLYAPPDRSVMVGLARLAAGPSPYAMVDAWADRAMHLARAPGRLVKLTGRAQSNRFKFLQHATLSLSIAPGCLGGMRLLTMARTRRFAI
ncbi:MAG: poly-beta-hydroxybutyrate polymerase N-terminal domain-containing protein [Rhodobacter sp.]|nr:poly-beta-hydroxybutyrate polymerase N-terminal domain-containing protein [Rhodobacter sp.]MCA3512010.1 poly-beta-hydroxybutyrate polymerase N-terminal domain-containing protein [Rhodobacter sp.]MCA3518787.1 poly-beta-hydroxybutyrate polymerase N-terminal domain-containing protein [Rhodobacter sp.]MCA3523339.1 poly-beta-hydroxybutyrate polymerase N-terminal domain-containing protein [Rhodobacter sp.]MCA3525797.1 poly-beta-hydroxybutyrate polymerase N-terminal domain-containing protein [Rhodo